MAQWPESFVFAFALIKCAEAIDIRIFNPVQSFRIAQTSSQILTDDTLDYGGLHFIDMDEYAKHIFIYIHSRSFQAYYTF